MPLDVETTAVRFVPDATWGAEQAHVFAFDLVQLFYELDVDVRVFRHDAIGLDEIEGLRPAWICISPGPRDPAHAGISKAVIERFGPTVPTLFWPPRFSTTEPIPSKKPKIF